MITFIFVVRCLREDGFYPWHSATICLTIDATTYNEARSFACEQLQEGYGLSAGEFLVDCINVNDVATAIYRKCLEG